MQREYVAVVQAGGKGTRMKSLTGDLIPKPMLLLNGKPLIQWQIENISKYGIKEFVFIIGHLGKKIREYFKDGSEFGVHIQYVEESKPLGSAGALYYLKNIIHEEDIIFIYGDVMICMDWNRILKFHESSHGKATLLVHPNAHPFDSDLLKMDKNNCITEIDFKTNDRNYWYSNCVNAGVHILVNEVIQGIKKVERLDLEKNILAQLMKKRVVYGYQTPEYVKDVGDPKRFCDAIEEQKIGLWEQKCLNRKQKCVFLDRDGTLNRYKGLIYKEEQFELENNVEEAIKILNRKGYLTIVITNQPVVARGLCSIKDVDRIHRKMQVLLGKKGAYIDDIMFCPHHPDKGYPEENVEYKILCECRKPAIGMVKKMVSKYNIDLSNSYMIGDTTVDIQTGFNAGMKTILVLTGEAGKDKKYDIKADIVAEDLLDAVHRIISI